MTAASGPTPDLSSTRIASMFRAASPWAVSPVTFQRSAFW